MISPAQLTATFDPGPMLDGVAERIRLQFGLQLAIEVAEAAVAKFRTARQDEDLAIWLALHARLAAGAACRMIHHNALN